MGPLTVLDTDVLVDHFRGLKDATSYIKSLRVGQRSTTDITVMELFKGAANQEELLASSLVEIVLLSFRCRSPLRVKP